MAAGKNQAQPVVFKKLVPKAVTGLCGTRLRFEMVHELIPNHPYSCRAGECGSCEVAVLEGEVEHRDEVLSDDEHEANCAMMLCVSRARSPRLVIDL